MMEFNTLCEMPKLANLPAVLTSPVRKHYGFSVLGNIAGQSKTVFAVHKICPVLKSREFFLQHLTY